MAFSAQTDHGQCEREDVVLNGIGKETTKEKAKVCRSCATFQGVLICVLHTVLLCKTCEEGIVLFTFGAVAFKAQAILRFSVQLFHYFVKQRYLIITDSSYFAFFS